MTAPAASDDDALWDDDPLWNDDPLLDLEFDEASDFPDPWEKANRKIFPRISDCQP